MSAERGGLERVARKLHEIELREGTATVKWDLMPEQHRDMYRKDAAEVLALLDSEPELDEPTWCGSCACQHCYEMQEKYDE